MAIDRGTGGALAAFAPPVFRTRPGCRAGVVIGRTDSPRVSAELALAPGRVPLVEAGTLADQRRPDPGADHSGLSRRVLVIWRLPWLAATILLGLAVALFVVGHAPGAAIAVVACCFLLVAVAAALVPGLRYRSWSYRVGPDSLEIRSGWFVRRESTVPYFRVQHIDIRRGPLERWRNVVALDISTASPTTSATLPGMEPSDAERLRAFVLARAGADDGV